MAYIIYVTYLTGIVSQLGSIGIPVTTRKDYMAEYLGGGDYTTARFIYFRTLLIQNSSWPLLSYPRSCSVGASRRSCRISCGIPPPRRGNVAVHEQLHLCAGQRGCRKPFCQSACLSCFYCHLFCPHPLLAVLVRTGESSASPSRHVRDEVSGFNIVRFISSTLQDLLLEEWSCKSACRSARPHDELRCSEPYGNVAHACRLGSL